MNKLIISGRLCQQPELKKTQSGKEYVQNCVAVRREFKGQEDETTDFVNIVIWGNQADYISKYANKGDRVEIVGRIQIDKYEKDGVVREKFKCIVENIYTFGQAHQAEQQKATVSDNEKDEEIFKNFLKEKKEELIEGVEEDDLPF